MNCIKLLEIAVVRTTTTSRTRLTSHRRKRVFKALSLNLADNLKRDLLVNFYKMIKKMNFL